MSSSTPKRSLRSSSIDKAVNHQGMIESMNTLKADLTKVFKDEIKVVLDRMAAIENRIDSFEASLSSLRLTQESHSQKIMEITKGLANMASELPTSILDEVEQRMHRRDKIVVSGIKELHSNDIEDRKSHDVKEIETLFEKLELNDVTPLKIHRIGKINNAKTRLIRVQLENEKSKHKVLASARSLSKISEYRGVYINPDRTQIQQLQDAHLRRELKERRGKNENVIIYRGRVINKSELSNGSNFL